MLGKLKKAVACFLLFWAGCAFEHGRVFSMGEEKVNTMDWIWPAEGVITDTFGTRGGKHKGIDIAAQKGSEIVSVESGMVTKSYYSNSYGNVIFVKHNSGFETVYAHLQKRYVREGMKVIKGERIGLMGSTGYSSGPHLHFEVHKNTWTLSKENSIDPLFVLGDKDPGETVHFHEKQKTIQTWAHLSSYVHKVKRGETLWNIAQKYGTTVEAIKISNVLSDDRIFPDQQLIIHLRDASRANGKWKK